MRPVLGLFRIGLPHMINENNTLDDADDEDDDDFLIELDDDAAYWNDEYVLVPEQEWEDWTKAQGLIKKNPGLFLMKVIGYTPKKFRDIEEWATESCEKPWKRIDWSGSCAYTVIIGFESSFDAVHYQLRWT